MIVTLTAALVTVAFAADEKPAPPPPKLGALVFGHFKYDLTDGKDGYSEFGVDRAYLFAQGQITDTLGARVTVDADLPKALVGYDATTGSAAVDTKMRVFLKHAWMEGKLPAGVKVRAGMVDTGWITYGEQFTNVRYITKQLADAAKLDSSADLGVNVQGQELNNMIDWHVGLYNGEGYSSPETDGGKALAARFAFDPLAPQNKMSLPIVVWAKDHFSNAQMDKSARSTASLAYGGAVGFKMPYVVFWGEVDGVSRDDDTAGLGESVSLVPRIPKVAELILRLDRWDPDTDTDKDDSTSIIAGVAHNFVEKTSVALTYEQTTVGGDADTATKGVFVRWQAGF